MKTVHTGMIYFITMKNQHQTLLFHPHAHANKMTKPKPMELWHKKYGHVNEKN